MAKRKLIRLENAHLKLEIEPEAAAFDVTQEPSGPVWTMDRSDRQDLWIEYKGEPVVLALSDAGEISARENLDGSVRVEYRRFRGIDSSLSVVLLFELKESDLRVEIDVNDADPAVEFGCIYYPRSFVLPKEKDSWWICPVEGAGKLGPATFCADVDGRLGWKPVLKCHGALQGKGGFLCIWEAVHDTYLAEMNSTRGGPRYFPRNLESLGRFRHRRAFTFSFRKNTDHAKLIREVYRPVAERRGYLVPLSERAKRKPRITDLPGTLIYHQLIAYVDRRRFLHKHVTFEQAGKNFSRMLEATGVKKGLYHLDGWCRQGYDALHPDVFPPLKEAGGEAGLGKLSRTVAGRGFHFGLHDNYLLYFPDAEQFDEADCVWDRRLKPHRDQFRAGGMNFVQSPPAALGFLIKNYVTGQTHYRRRWRAASAYCELGFCYLDQFLHSGGGHEQDYNPEHPLTREEFVLGMLELIDVLGDKLGLITSSEHMFEFANPHYDVNGNSSGVALRAPAEGVVPVPLWELAFHECMVPTDVASGPRNFVGCALIGGAMHHRPGYDDDEDVTRRVHEAVRRAAPLRRLHEEVCFREMTGHRLLKADGSVQESDFEGIRVVGDFGKATVEISGSRKADGVFRFDDLSRAD